MSAPVLHCQRDPAILRNLDCTVAQSSSGAACAWREQPGRCCTATSASLLALLRVLTPQRGPQKSIDLGCTYVDKVMSFIALM